MSVKTMDETIRLLDAEHVITLPDTQLDALGKNEGADSYNRGEFLRQAARQVSDEGLERLIHYFNGRRKICLAEKARRQKGRT